MKRSVLTTLLTTFSMVLSLILLLAGCRTARTVDAMKPHATISFAYNEGLRHPPSYAVWVEDESGNSVTLYSTRKAADHRWSVSVRPSALPIWSGIRETDVDAVSSATPSKKAFIQCNLPEQLVHKKFKLYIEANASFDYNDFYKQGLKENEKGYNDVNGQPSVLWVAEIDPLQGHGEVMPVLTGSGDVLGADHEVHPDLGNISTARELLKDIKIEYDFVKQ